MAATVGQQAPDFALYDTRKQLVKLEDLRDRNLVLLFFPLAFTGTCTKELCSVRDSFATYNKLDAAVFGISVDSVFTLDKFKQEQGLNFELLSDFNKEASSAYGALYNTLTLNMQGVSKRAAFVIDRGGVTRYAEVLENAGELPNFDAIQATLQSLNQ